MAPGSRGAATTPGGLMLGGWLDVCGCGSLPPAGWVQPGPRVVGPPGVACEEMDMGTDASDALWVEVHGTTVELGGALVAVAQVAELTERLRGQTIERLDLGDLDLDDGPALAALVTLVRRLSDNGLVTVFEAPQMLAHTLYKVGMLRGGRLVLLAPRMDQGTTAG